MVGEEAVHTGKVNFPPGTNWPSRDMLVAKAQKGIRADGRNPPAWSITWGGWRIVLGSRSCPGGDQLLVMNTNF